MKLERSTFQAIHGLQWIEKITTIKINTKPPGRLTKKQRMQDSIGHYKSNDWEHTTCCSNQDLCICPRYLYSWIKTSHQQTELFCNLGLDNLWDLYNGMQTSPSKLISILKGCIQTYLLLWRLEPHFNQGCGCHRDSHRNSCSWIWWCL